MRLRDILTLPAARDLRVIGEVISEVPGESAWRDAQILLAHVVDVPDPGRWVRPGTLLLTTGLSWPRDPGEVPALAAALAEGRPCGVVLAVPKFFAAFPPELARALWERGVACFELPWEVPFAQLVSEVHGAILEEQAATLQRSERLHRALTRAALGGQPSDVAATLALELGREVALLSPDGQAGVRAGETPGSPAPLPPGAVRSALARPGDGPRALGGGFAVPVLLRGERGGGVWVAGEPDPHARRAAEQAATVAALLLLAEREAEVREARLGYAFVDTLLEGRFASDPGAQERAARLGFDPGAEYVVCRLSLDLSLPLNAEGFSTRERAAAAVRTGLRSLGAAPLVGVSLDSVWFIVPGSLPPERLWARLGWDQPGRAPGGLVYGRPRSGASGLAQSRAEVLLLAPHTRPGEVRSYSEVLVPRALSGDPEAQRDLVGALLGPLLGARGGAALLATVEALSASGFSQAAAAAALGIHANTLRYRTERIEALSGHSLSRPEHRPLWWLALELRALHPGEGTD